MNHQELQQRIDAAIEQHDFSGVVRIAQHGAVVYERAAGYADRSNRIANTPATRFGIASGTKCFTALAIGKLIEAGKLTFDTRLQECVALDMPQYAPEITIAHLLNHTSGIPDYLDEDLITDFDNFSVGIPWYELLGPRDYLAVFPDAPMKFAPGERFSYSNGGYILLGVVIEAISGMRYQEFVEQQVLRPIGMQQSGFFSFNRLPEQTAFGYIEEDAGWRTNIYNLPIIGASDGGMYTTAADLATMWQSLWDGTLLSADLVEQYTRPQVAVPDDDPLAYGYGFWLRGAADPGHEIYLIGADAGVSFRSLVNHQHALQATVLANTSKGAWPIVREIDALLHAG
ncbi:MAG TPA: serine hydrolase domain-containing protein [Roseiflexaceae bacterium]|nr:serine hydrolase domain-containing protein [Roseiflexaceae bacterium]HMP39201.1 serine hydrolase domain-containing protein [Roseiflexaceae bacterium]